MGVFLPHIYSVKELEALIKEDATLKGYEVKIFARVKDLLATHKSDAFDVVLLPASVKGNKQIGNMEPQFTLLRKGKNLGKLLLVTLKGADKGKKSVAAIDEAGKRKASKSIVKERLNGKIKRIKLVKKGLDLVPMLSLGNVNHILIDEHDLEIVKKQSEAQFEIIETLEIEAPIFFVKKDQKGKHDGLLKVEAKTISKFGYDKVGSVK
ncbi:hypothetical protein [Pseudobacteriovorax antillogorgiicola]|nr:hypothetical protein [Pseudobacteriovorax antillogorgiicola]